MKNTIHGVFAIGSAVLLFLTSYSLAGCGGGRIGFGSITDGGAGPSGEGGGPGSVPADGGGVASTLSVTRVYPPSNARGTVLNIHASLTFSGPMDPASITPATIRVFMLGGTMPNISPPIKTLAPAESDGMALAGSLAYDESTNTVTFIKDGEWRDCMRYRIIALSGEAGVRGVGGETLSEDYASEFFSSCPQVYTYDIDTAMDIGYAVHVAPDVSGTPRMYVAGSTVMREGTMPYLYSVFANRWDVSGDIGNPDWSPAYVQFGDWWNFPALDQPQGTDILLDETGNLITIGYGRDRGHVDGLLEKIGSTGLPLSGSEVRLSEAVDINCRGLAQSPVTGSYVITCAEFRGDIKSYLFVIDSAGTIVGRGAYADLWNGQMFRSVAMDADGNAYVTLAPLEDFQTDGRLRILKFNANDLVARQSPLEDPIPEPVAVAVHPQVNSYGWDLAISEEYGEIAYYVAGSLHSHTRVGVYDAIMVKFNAAGELVWEVQHGGPGANATADDAFTAIAVDYPSIYIAGFEGRDLDPVEDWDQIRRNMIMGKYHDNGDTVEEVFFKSFILTPGYGNANSSAAFDIFIDETAMNEIYAVGYIYKGDEGKNVAIWRSDNNGVGTPYCMHEANFGPECPEAPDLCTDGFDNDANGFTDCADAACRENEACETSETRCTDGFDNDGDGDTDCADDDCLYHHTCGGTETDCGDGIDNDGDGQTDCHDWDDCMEGKPVAPCEYPHEATCDDDFDNDADGLVDCNDPDCSSQAVCGGTETSCSNEIDDDGDGDTDCDDPDCVDDPFCIAVEVCDNGIDDDGDDLVDCDDPDCADDPTCAGEICTNNLDDDGDGDVDCMDADCPWRNPGDPCYTDCMWDACFKAEDAILTNYPGITCDDLAAGCCEAWFFSASVCNVETGCCELDDEEGVPLCSGLSSCAGAEDNCTILRPDWCTTPSTGDYCTDFWGEGYACSDNCCIAVVD